MRLQYLYKSHVGVYLAVSHQTHRESGQNMDFLVEVVLWWFVVSIPVSILIGRALADFSAAYPEVVEITAVSTLER